MTDTTVTLKVAPDLIEVWVCPNCGSYYASSTATALDKVQNHRTSMQNSADEDPSEWGKASGPMSLCQICKSLEGIEVKRELRQYICTDSLSGALKRVFQQKEAEEAKRSGSRKQVPYNRTREVDDS